MALTVEQLANGLAPEKDLVFPACPADPEMRESVSAWLFDEEGRFAFSRGGIEAEAHSWDQRRLQGNFSFADGTVLNGAGVGPAPSPIDADGRPTILGAGALTFQCIEPFKRWTMVFDGAAQRGTVQQQIESRFGSDGAADVRFAVDMEMVTPAWIQDNSVDTSKMSAAEAANAAAMGLGYRFEHHLRWTGTLTIDGRTETYHGTGTRIHRQSIRTLVDFPGHCWFSAVFPDGRAFGSLVYPPRKGQTEGDFSYNDACLYQDGKLVPAKVIRSTFLRRIVPEGDGIELELESEFGRTLITGTTALSTFRIGNPDMGGSLNMQQGAALFRWDDQQAYGMVERSTAAEKTVVG
jgi:hypothetical protein